MNVRRAAILVAALLPTVPLSAQAQEDEVLSVVNRLFDGMRTKDSSMVRSVFHPNARMVSFRGDSTVPGSIDRFVQFMGTPSEEIWNEPIWDAEVRVDGNLAMVWTKYAFLRGPNGDQLSHCGVDAFFLHRGAGGWKISVLTDTRQQEGCEMPPGH